MNLRSEIRQIKKALDKVEDIRLIGVIKELLAYARFKEGFELTDVHRAILDERKARHVRGASKSYTWADVKIRARSRG